MKAADGKITYITVAAEVEGIVPFIRAVVKRGVVVALGHQNADARAIDQAVEAGARLSTHLGNGLMPEIGRHENPIWPQLADDRLTASLIPDLFHLPPDMLKAFVRAKGPENVVFTSDLVHLAGLKTGTYTLAGVEVEVRGGRTRVKGTSLLAGGTVMLPQGIVNAARVTDMNLEQAFAAATTIPARLLGLRHRFALPQVGRKADFLVFDIRKTRTSWTPVVRGVYINGRPVLTN